MIEDQIIRRGIRDSLVIESMKAVDRALFVRDNDKSEAYEDYPLPIGFGQTISQPYIVAYMLEQLKLQPFMKVLEIGTGSGYQTALLSQIVSEVVTIERIPQLAIQARNTLKINGFGNITIIEGDGYTGWPDSAPFDGIIVSAAAPEVPACYLDQLSDMGRLIIPLGNQYGTQYLTLFIKDERNRIEKKNLLAVRFVPFLSENF